MVGRTMVLSLDRISRDTLGRFGLKILFSLLIAGMAKTGYVLAASGWLALYAMFTAVLALMFRQRIPTPSFNHWDEAMWLATLSMGLRLIHRAF